MEVLHCKIRGASVKLDREVKKPTLRTRDKIMSNGRRAVRMSLEDLLETTATAPASFTRKRRTVVPKPTILDDEVLYTYKNDEPLSLTVPRWATDDTLKLLRKSVRYLSNEMGEEMKLKVQAVPVAKNQTEVRFHAHPPLERGRRVSMAR